MTNEKMNLTPDSFDSYQSIARTLNIYPLNNEGLLAHALGLGNEAGEVLGKLKKTIRDSGSNFIDPKLREDIKAELGDTLWYLANIAQDFGLNLSDIAEANITKLLDRKQRNVLSGSGDNR